MDNRLGVTTDATQMNPNKPTNPKKRRHTRKHGSLKAKRSKGQEAEGSDDDQSTSPGQVFFPPEVLEALKQSLREDIIDICEQTVRAAVTHSDSPSTSNSSSSPPPQKKARTQHHPNTDGNTTWLTKAARKQQLHLDDEQHNKDDADIINDESFPLMNHSLATRSKKRKQPKTT